MKLERHDGIGVLLIDTDRNNAINVDSIRESHALMDEAERDPSIRALIVTSTHASIFCPGVDLPSLMNNSRAEMRAFYEAMTGLVRRKFAYPKPEIYALNGHTIAGGLMMALAGDYRIIANGKYSVGLMEIELGLASPIGVVTMLAHVLGGRGAERVLFRGERYSPEVARELGLVDEVVEKGRLDGPRYGKRPLARAKTGRRLSASQALFAASDSRPDAGLRCSPLRRSRRAMVCAGNARVGRSCGSPDGQTSACRPGGLTPRATLGPAFTVGVGMPIGL